LFRSNDYTLEHTQKLQKNELCAKRGYGTARLLVWLVFCAGYSLRGGIETCQTLNASAGLVLKGATFTSTTAFRPGCPGKRASALWHYQYHFIVPGY
jgi:hypothetical protein